MEINVYINILKSFAKTLSKDFVSREFSVKTYIKLLTHVETIYLASVLMVPTVYLPSKIKSPKLLLPLDFDFLKHFSKDVNLSKCQKCEKYGH